MTQNSKALEALERLGGYAPENWQCEEKFSGYLEIIRREIQSQEWYKISTAPKDGKEMWLSDGKIVEVGKWQSENGEDENVHQGMSCYDIEYWITEAGFHSSSFYPNKNCEDSKYEEVDGIQPTHWMQLQIKPKPPKELKT